MKKLFTLICFTHFIFLTAFSQNIDSIIAKYATEYGQERIYMHYDKASYTPNDTIWFTAYLKEGISPAAGSKTFYADWTDEKGTLLYHTVSPIINGVTNGQLNIPADYDGKFIHVKAYTKWMLNFDTAFLYEKDIRVLTNKKPTATIEKAPAPTLIFFPEGGDAIAGISNKIAFKATDSRGVPVKVTGVIKNKAGKTIDSLRTQHDGMGYFFLIPSISESYTAKWKDEKGKEYSTPLPEIKKEGYALQISDASEKKIFLVTADSNTVQNAPAVHIIGTMNQYQAFKVSKNLSAGPVKGVIPTGGLPSGILTITLFDEKWVARAERVTYINNDEYRFDASMNVEHWGLNKRARNEIELTIPDSLYATLSIAVTDEGIETDSADNIISHLMLTSELKGQVFNPAYYFSTANEKAVEHLDLVMLTNGWRRFKWEDVVAGKFPVINYARDTSFLALSGKVYGVTPTQLRNNPSIVLVFGNNEKKGMGDVLQLPVSSDGSFIDRNISLFDTAKVYYQLSKSLTGAAVKFMEDRLPPLKTRSSAKGLFYNAAADTTGYARHLQLSDELSKLFEQYQGKTLDNVTLKTKVKSVLEEMDEKYASGLFSGGDSYKFDLINDKFAASAQSIFTYLQGKVAGLQITGAPQSPSLQWRGGAPALYLDETAVDISLLSNVNITDVAYIKVMRPPFFGPAAGGGSGAIAVYTRRGNDVSNEPGKGLANNSIAIYTPVRQFYAPNYSSFSQANEVKDLRTTLYWNPQTIITPQNNKVLFTFYNNDVSKAFRVRIEGMSTDGRLFHMEQVME